MKLAYNVVRSMTRRLSVGIALALLASVMVISLGFGFASVDAEPADQRTQIDCRSYAVPVRLQRGETATNYIYGELCTPAGRSPDVVQLLLPGGTYSGIYWDWPYQPERYSYVRNVVPHGYATFNIDRIGIGRSSHPLSTRIDLNVNAYVAHQVVHALRSGGWATGSRK